MNYQSGYTMKLKKRDNDHISLSLTIYCFNEKIKEIKLNKE